MDIRIFHMYNRLVRRGLTNPLSCPTCLSEYVLRATVDAEPVLQCVYCDSMVQPGLKIYDRIKAVVSEFYT